MLYFPELCTIGQLYPAVNGLAHANAPNEGASIIHNCGCDLPVGYRLR